MWRGRCRGGATCHACLLPCPPTWAEAAGSFCWPLPGYWTRRGSSTSSWNTDPLLSTMMSWVCMKWVFIVGWLILCWLIDVDKNQCVLWIKCISSFFVSHLPHHWWWVCFADKMSLFPVLVLVLILSLSLCLSPPPSPSLKKIMLCVGQGYLTSHK